ncbi:MAG: ABC transporter substrate-binding protein [Bacteroidales bacterium]|nr:ABC transporter substrate-binding protein [Bacteroidales bacterium]
MTKIKISAVSYTNTLPFIYGIENSDIINHIELAKDIPSVCAQKLLDNKVDLGLIPVAVIPKLNHSEIISDYCIGASGPVRSVILASYKPLNEIDTIYLDYHSRSSVMLTRILAKKFWKINVKWTDTSDGFENRIKENEAAVIIGDKALVVEKKFPFVYDLAEEWIKNTKLPFVFAAWVSNKNLGSTFKTEFNAALKNGLDRIDDVIKTYDFSVISNHISPKTYLEKNIDFQLDEKKINGMNLFLEFAKDFQ